VSITRSGPDVGEASLSRSWPAGTSPAPRSSTEPAQASSAPRRTRLNPQSRMVRLHGPLARPPAGRPRACAAIGSPPAVNCDWCGRERPLRPAPGTSQQTGERCARAVRPSRRPRPSADGEPPTALRSPSATVSEPSKGRSRPPPQRRHPPRRGAARRPSPPQTTNKIVTYHTSCISGEPNSW
jgi:hypothetical protein